MESFSARTTSFKILSIDDVLIFFSKTPWCRLMRVDKKLTHPQGLNARVLVFLSGSGKRVHMIRCFMW